MIILKTRSLQTFLKGEDHFKYFYIINIFTYLEYFYGTHTIEIFFTEPIW